MPTILSLCTGNACRSQMAEGFVRDHIGQRVESLLADELSFGSPADE